MRTQIRQVMRFAGPRMLLHGPIAAVQHLAQTLRKPSPAAYRARAAHKPPNLRNSDTTSPHRDIIALN